MTSVNSRRPSVHKRLVTPLLWNGFSAITSLFFVVDRRIAFLESVNFCYVCLYANFQFSWWSRDHFLVPFRPNAWSQTLQTSKRHTFIVSAFHRYHWFGVKLFPFGSSNGTLKTPTLQNSGIFHDSTRPHFHFDGLPPKSLRSVRCLCLWDLECVTNITKNTVVLVWPGAAHAPIAVYVCPQVYSVQ